MKGGKVKKGPRTLGRKGLRKYRATNNYTWPGEESNEYPGGQAQLLRKLGDEGGVKLELGQERATTKSMSM